MGDPRPRISSMLHGTCASLKTSSNVCRKTNLNMFSAKVVGAGPCGNLCYFICISSLISLYKRCELLSSSTMSPKPGGSFQDAFAREVAKESFSKSVEISKEL